MADEHTSDEERIKALKEWIVEWNPKALFCDGHDKALLGVAERFGMEPVAAYDYDKLIESLMEGGMSREEAEEWYGFNIVDAWLGEGTPIFVRTKP